MPEEPIDVAPSPWWVERPAGDHRVPRSEPRAPGRIVIREPANIRREPGLAAPVIRVTSAGMVLRVFGQRGDWLQVGDSAPWGWVHMAVAESGSWASGGGR